MSGRFEKAPLVYVTAQVRTSSRPSFKEDQWADFQHALIRQGLKVHKESTNHEIIISELFESGDNVHPEPRKKSRHGFFGHNTEECLILGNDFIEFRTTNYFKYGQFRDRFCDLLTAITSSVTIFGEIDAQEITLTYCDAIVPAYGNPLEDYFKKGNSVLPLTLVDEHTDDLFQAGQSQATRIVTPKQKVTISLEQIPFNAEKRVSKWLPNNLIEPDSDFAMPLKIREEWRKKQSGSHFSLLSTQASMITDSSLHDLSFKESLDELHTLTKRTFKEIIDENNCRRDWGYIEEEGASNA